MAGPNTLTGNYGTMGSDLLLRKMERSCVPGDNANQLRDYFRQELKDTRPVPALFEYEQPRGGRDENGEARGGFQSKGMLSLRHHGKRNQATPWLPDGTFLDFEGTHKDPRSIMNGPDMHKHRDQQKARGKFVRFYDDSSHTIPERGWAPYDLIQKIKHAQYETADRMKIFSTSKSGMHTGSQLMPSTTTTHGKSAPTQKESIIADFTLRNRRNKTTSLSNDTSIGWRRGVDHEFKVSRYGMAKSNMGYADQDWGKNRSNARTGHEVFIQRETKNIPRDTALAIINLTQMKRNKQAAGDAALFGKSVEGIQRTQRQIAADMVQALYNAKESRAADPHALIQGERINQNGVLTYDGSSGTRISAAVINPIIIEKMASVNRTMKEREVSDLREAIQQSAADQGVYLQDGNRSANLDLLGDTVEAKHKSMADFEAGEEKQVAQYDRVVLPSGKSKMNGMSGEAYGGVSAKNDQRSQVKFYSKQDVDSTVIDNQFGVEREIHKGTAGLGSKYTMRSHQTDHLTSEMNDW